MRPSVLFCVTVGLLLASPANDAQVPPQAHLAIVGVTVVDVETGRTIPGQTIVLNAGRITTIGAATSIPVPTGAHVVEGKGKFLIPGLIDTHVHLGNSAQRDQLQAIGPLLAHGVTGVRDAAERAIERIAVCR